MKIESVPYELTDAPLQPRTTSFRFRKCLPGITRLEIQTSEIGDVIMGNASVGFRDSPVGIYISHLFSSVLTG